VKAEEFYLENTLDACPIEALGWLLYIFADNPPNTGARDEIVRYFERSIVLDKGKGYFHSFYEPIVRHTILYDSNRTSAIVLYALAHAKIQTTLVSALVTSLLEARTNGRWLNTQVNCWAILALSQYFDDIESHKPNATVRGWLDDSFIGEIPFKEYSLDSHQIKVPLKYITEGKIGAENQEEKSSELNLLLHREGKGPIYYRIGLTYAPKSFNIEPANYGFAVTRKFLSLDPTRPITQVSDNVYKVIVGTKFSVSISVQVTHAKRNVAIVDKLAGGVECIIPESTEPSPYWIHRNLRDDRVEWFSREISLFLSTQFIQFEYVARATSVGEYVVPPCHVEEMYDPEVFGHTSSCVMIIE